MFQESTNKSFQRLEVEVEQTIVNQKSKLNEEDIDKLEEIFKIFKTEGYKERQRYEILCKDFKKNVTNMNEQSIRGELIQ